MKYIKEYNSLGYYYDMDYSDRPPGVKAIERISIRDRTIAFIKSRLGITHNIHLDGRNASGGVGFCRFSYNVVTGEIGEIGEIKLGRRSRSVHIYEYEDEWFKVYIDDRMYWCDQVDSVVSCIRNMIDYEVSSHINESSNNVYYQESSDSEFDNNVAKPSDSLPFSDGEFNLLNKLHPDNYFERYKEKSNWNYVYFIMFVNPYKLKGDIYKLADEWYLVRFDIYDRQLNRHRTYSDVLLSDKAYYYKCDQIEGLIYFLKKLKDSVWLDERNGSISLMNPM